MMQEKRMHGTRDIEMDMKIIDVFPFRNTSTELVSYP